MEVLKCAFYAAERERRRRFSKEDGIVARVSRLIPHVHVFVLLQTHADASVGEQYLEEELD